MPEAVAVVGPRRPKMTIENQMKASQWLFRNTAILANMTLEEITGAINGQARVDQSLVPQSVRRLMDAAGMAWKPRSKTEARLKLQGVYDKMLTLQGRLEQHEAVINDMRTLLERHNSKIDAIVANTQWIADNPEGR